MDAERDTLRRMAGDDLIANPTHTTSLGITIQARPEFIWPWLLQLGYQRGGLYSYDWLDRLFGYLDRPSTDRILPEFQHLAPGDEIPMGRGPGFPVRIVEPFRALVLGGAADNVEWTWQFGLFPIDGAHTRLVTRYAGRIPSSLGSRLFMAILKPAAFVMTRRMLLGLKWRSERLVPMTAPPGAAAALAHTTFSDAN